MDAPAAVPAVRDWVAELSGSGAGRERAVAELHGLLLRGARFEIGRRRASLSHIASSDVDDLAMQAADDALVAILGKLDVYNGSARFTTWAYKFVLLEAAVKARRKAWQAREVVLDGDGWASHPAAGPTAQDAAESNELLRAIRAAVESELTAHQRQVLTALALDGVPIDVLAERLGTTRGALYKTLHDARRKLRGALAAAGLALDTTHMGDGRDR